MGYEDRAFDFTSLDINARASDDELNRWIKHGVGYARSLPPR